MSPVEFFSAGLCHKIANPWDLKNELFDVFNVHLFFFKFDKSCYFYIKKARHDNFCLVIPDKMIKMKKKGTSCDRRTGTGTPDAFSAH